MRQQRANAHEKRSNFKQLKVSPRRSYSEKYRAPDISCLVLRRHSPGRVEPASSIDDVSWVGSTPRSPVQASLHLEALQIKLS